MTRRILVAAILAPVLAVAYTIAMIGFMSFVTWDLFWFGFLMDPSSWRAIGIVTIGAAPISWMITARWFR